MLNSRESWLERQIAESESDPLQNQIVAMLHSIQEVNEPDSIIDDSEIPEFSIDYSKYAGRVVQGTFESTTGFPLRTDGVRNCQVAIAKTPRVEENIDTMVHIWAGDFELNRPGYRLEEFAETVTPGSSAVFFTGIYNPNVVIAARQMMKNGITTLKNIRVNTGDNLLNVAYRPKSNLAFVKVGNPINVRLVRVYKVF